MIKFRIKHKLKFTKIMYNIHCPSYTVVCDDYLIKMAMNVCKEHNINFVSFDCDLCDKCTLIVKCTKKEFNDFVFDYIDVFGSKIKEIKFK